MGVVATVPCPLAEESVAVGAGHDDSVRMQGPA